MRAELGVDRVELDGQPIGAAEATVHFAVHKPRGLLSSAHDERGRDAVVGLVPASAFAWPPLAGRPPRRGLRGADAADERRHWANRVLHPRYGLEREYAVLVAELPTLGSSKRSRPA